VREGKHVGNTEIRTSNMSISLLARVIWLLSKNIDSKHWHITSVCFFKLIREDSTPPRIPGSGLLGKGVFYPG